LLPALGASVLGIACGPSMQSVHEGSVRFEHCYRLDLDEDVASTHRRACWKEWSSRYTYGQSRDHIEYARRRLRSLAAGDTARPTIDVGSDYHPEERQFYLSVPAPTSAHAPPPPIATRWAGPNEPPPAASASAGVPTSSAPGDDCAATCRGARTPCDAACQKASAGNTSPADASACDRCNTDYKRCMARCFK
jgi:hypothetical protein